MTGGNIWKAIAVLAKAAAVVLGVLRVTDFAARYGDEAIAIILPSTGPRGAAKVAAKLRSAIEPLRSPLNVKLEGRRLGHGEYRHLHPARARRRNREDAGNPASRSRYRFAAAMHQSQNRTDVTDFSNAQG